MNASALDWDRVDTVMLDMDGTILDLAFDNHFWQQLVPERFADLRGISLDQAHSDLQPLFRHWEGQLQWYCLDHWTELTGLDLRALKSEARDRIRMLPTSQAFLDWARLVGKPLWLVTNAHRATLEIKLEVTGIESCFDAIVSSHDFGYPKESPEFWAALETGHSLRRERALFVDDSLPVLRAAQAYGVGQLVAIRNPDSTQPPRHTEDFVAVDGLDALIPAAGQLRTVPAD